MGGGLAAANCARHLREQEAQGDILIVGREPDPPYNRPPLTKTYLRGEESREDILFRPDEWYAEQRIDLLTRTSVTSLDLESRSGEALQQGRGALRQGAARDRLERAHPARRGRAAGRDPLPAHDAQLRRAAGGAREGRARRADRRQLHRDRAGGVVHEARQAVRADHARVGHARALLRCRRSGATSRTCSRRTACTCHGSQELERFEGSGDRVGTRRDQVGPRDRLRLRRDRRRRARRDIMLAQRPGSRPTAA